MRDLREGDTIGPYVLERTIDRGAFGRVWRAVDSRSGKTVAIKVLASEDADEEHTRARTDLERLAAAAARDSRHIVRVLASGHVPVAHIVMEFVDGTNLRDELSDRGALPQEEAIRIALEVADALRALHRVRVVHRDVKPANILLDQNGEVRLTDFGIAKILGYDETVTLTQQNLLSAPYAAPEVWEGAPNPQSDIYAFGAVLFEMLAGRPPFQGDLMDLFRQHRAAEPDLGALPAHIAPSLKELVYLCLRKSPGERPPNAEASIRMLERAREELRREPDHFGPWVRVEPDPYRDWAWLCRHERSGEEAVVEVHFAEDEAVGVQIRAAVNISAKIVPFGAEALLGTNRLLLADDEGWPNAPEHNVAFWVARQGLDASQSDAEIDREAALRATETFIKMIDAANSGGVRLSIDADRAVVRAGGAVQLHRPGLPPQAPVEPRLGAFILLRSLPLSQEAAAIASTARDLRDLREKLARAASNAAGNSGDRGRSRHGPLLVAAGLGAMVVAFIAVAAALITRSDGSPGQAAIPTEVSGSSLCAPVTIPSPIAAVRQACARAGVPGFELDEECARGQVCKIDAKGGVAVLRGNDQTIAYVDSNGDLSVAREGDFSTSRLLQDGRVREPAWSPEGRYIAYVLAKPTSGGLDTELWIVDTKDPASGLEILASSDSASVPEFRRRRISQPRWGADGKTLYFLWQAAEAGPELWSIELPQRGGVLDTRELRLWSGAPRNLSQARPAAIDGQSAGLRLASISIAPDGSVVAEYCLTKEGGCGLATWTAEGVKVIVPAAPGARFISPVQSSGRWLALSLDGPDAVLLQIDASGAIKPITRVPAGLNGSAPDPADLSLAASADGARALVGTPAGLHLVSINDATSNSIIAGKWGAWYSPEAAIPGSSPPPATPFATPILTPLPSPSATALPGGDSDLAGDLVASSCVIGQELAITVRNLGPSTLDRDIFITVRTLSDSVTRIGSTNKGHSALQPGQSVQISTGYVVREPVQVVIDNVRDRRPENNVVTCVPR